MRQSPITGHHRCFPLCVFNRLLTEFGGHDGDVVLGHRLPVQQLVGGDGSLHGVDVEVAVQVALPVDGVPGDKGGNRARPRSRVRWTSQVVC